MDFLLFINNIMHGFPSHPKILCKAFLFIKKYYARIFFSSKNMQGFPHYDQKILCKDFLILIKKYYASFPSHPKNIMQGYPFHQKILCKDFLQKILSSSKNIMQG